MKLSTFVTGAGEWNHRHVRTQLLLQLRKPRLELDGGVIDLLQLVTLDQRDMLSVEASPRIS